MSWKKLFLPALAVPVVWLLYFGMTRDPNIVESPLPGNAAFAFEAPTLDGDTISLAELEGNVVVLNFWASWCVACIDEHRVFVEAERFYAGQPFQMLGVVYQDEPPNAERWMARMGGSWPSLIDKSSRIAIDYGVYGVPETYFIGKDGLIAHKQIGPVNSMLMKGLVDSLLAAPAGGTPQTSATGSDVPVGRSDGHTNQPPGSGTSAKEGGSDR